VSRLSEADAFLFDVDGTLVLSEDPNTGVGGVQALPGACELLRSLRTHGKRYVCFTNGTGQVPRAIAAKLRSVGLDVADSEVLTPASVAAEHIREAIPGEAVLAFGTEGLLEPLQRAGIPLASLEEAERATASWSAGHRLDLYRWTRALALRVAQRALFGFDPDASPYHFAVVLSRGEDEPVWIEERFAWGTVDTVDGELRPPTPKAVLDRYHWGRIADAARAAFNRRLKEHGMPSAAWRTGWFPGPPGRSRRCGTAS